MGIWSDDSVNLIYRLLIFNGYLSSSSSAPSPSPSSNYCPNYMRASYMNLISPFGFNYMPK